MHRLDHCFAAVDRSAVFAAQVNNRAHNAVEGWIFECRS
jgi:hypothetical protein